MSVCCEMTEAAVDLCRLPPSCFCDSWLPVSAEAVSLRCIWQTRLYVVIQKRAKIITISPIHLPGPFLIVKNLWQKGRWIACVGTVLPSCVICSLTGGILMGRKKLQFSCLLTFFQCILLHFSSRLCFAHLHQAARSGGSARCLSPHMISVYCCSHRHQS